MTDTHSDEQQVDDSQTDALPDEITPRLAARDGLKTTDLRHDTAYEDGRITSVETVRDADGRTVAWQIDSTLGSLQVDRPAHEIVEPRPRMRLRLYTVGNNGLNGVRGVAISSDVVFYQTVCEYHESARRAAEQEDQEKRDRFEQVRERLDAEYADLPSIFRARIEKFRRTSDEFRWRFEEYEMACCVLAVKLANETGGDPDRIEALKHVENAERIRLMSGIVSAADENGWRCAIALAKAYATDPPYVVLIHGAASLIYGCPRYGCPHPVPVDLIPGGQETLDRIAREVRERTLGR